MLESTFYKLGYKRSSVDHSIFYKPNIIIAVETDDIAIAGKDDLTVDTFIAGISEHFDITNNGNIHWFLNCAVKRDRAAHTISLNQSAYIVSMATKFGLTDAKPVHNPALPGQTIADPGPDDEPITNVPYTEAIGSLLWPSLISRLDIAFQVTLLARFTAVHTKAYWKAVKRVMAYLNTTKDLWLTFGGAGIIPKLYCDVDWASQADRFSVAGYALVLGTGAITWNSKKQNVVALSSTEAEYIAQTHALKEAMWMRNFLSELPFPVSLFDPTNLLSDNQGAIALAKDNKYHSRTKHIDICFHFIRNALKDKLINLDYVPTENNISDIFTKALPLKTFLKFRNALGLRPA